MYVDGDGHMPEWLKTMFGVGVSIGLAVVSVAAIVASGGTLLVPVIVGAAVGSGLNLVGQGVSNLMEGKGFFENINWQNVGLGALTGAAFATGVGGFWGAVSIGAFSNAGMSAFENKSWANIGFSFVIGGVASAAGYGLGKYVSNKLLSINTNLGLGDYVNMAKIDGANFLQQNLIALDRKSVV